jgi:hypothetical protein
MSYVAAVVPLCCGVAVTAAGKIAEVARERVKSLVAHRHSEVLGTLGSYEGYG